MEFNLFVRSHSGNVIRIREMEIDDIGKKYSREKVKRKE